MYIPVYSYHNKYTYEMGVYDLSMKHLTGKSHTTVGIMTVCSITVTQKLAVLSISRIYTFGDTIFSSKSTFTRLKYHIDSLLDNDGQLFYEIHLVNNTSYFPSSRI